MTEKNYSPYDSHEYEERRLWEFKVAQRELNIIPCISAWFDICGFGNALEGVGWNLASLRDNGLFEALARAYSRLGYPFISGVPPMPTERVFIINDGIARTTDLSDPVHVNPVILIFYLRDLLTAHYQLLNVLVEHGLGLRTVLAGGERCQYSPASVTGQSILHHMEVPSEYGKHLLGQQFVYNPSEFQMNTAFAMAYTIEALGTKGGVKPNRLYISKTWVDRLIAVLPYTPVIKAGLIEIPWGDSPGISIAFDEQLAVKAKGFDTDVFRVCRFTVHTALEGEETTFPMNEHDHISAAHPNPAM